MTGEPAYDGLLHLGSLAIVITAGYLGIDRLRSDRKTLADELRRIRDEVKAMLDALNFSVREPVDLPGAYRIHPMYVLCYVAQVRIRNVPLPSRCWSFFCRLRHVPLLNYFRSGMDRKIIGVLAVVSIVTYLTVALATIWQPAWLRNEWVLTGFFALFTAIIIWIFISASVALLRLKRLGQICMGLKGTLTTEIQKHALINFKEAQTTLEASILDATEQYLADLDE